jgi:hypothetical protein
MTLPIWAWAGTLAVFAVLMAADLVLTRNAVGFRAAVVSSVLWIAAAVAFGGVPTLAPSSGPPGMPPMSTALPAADRTGRRARRPTTEQNDPGESTQTTNAALAAPTRRRTGSSEAGRP